MMKMRKYDDMYVIIGYFENCLQYQIQILKIIFKTTF